MSTKSLASRSLMNSGVALTMYFVNLVLQFYSRKVFLDYLGTEILGLNTTATNILNLFNLAEMGISNAVAFSLYKPLQNNDIESIKGIVALQGKFIKFVATIILICSAVIMVFFPIFFDKMKLPLWYAYTSFAVLLLSSLLGYFVNYKQIVLSADLKDYKIQLSYKLSNFFKLILQIVVIKHADNPYVWWLIIEGLFALISAGALNIMVYRTYPYLKNYRNAKFSDLNRQYPEILTKTKQLFFHKISGVSLFQISPLLIYVFFSLSIVTMYYNYMIVIMGVISLSIAIFNSVAHGIGNLIARGNKDYTIQVFYELFCIRFVLISTICFGVFIGYQSFISLWIGEEYLLPMSSVVLFTTILYFYLSRYIVYDFINGYGFYEDVWAAIAEVLINIGCSYILGIFGGLNGIISGILIALIVISTIWKPIFLLRCKLGLKMATYFWTFFKLNCVGLIFFIANYKLYQLIFDTSNKTWIGFTLNTLGGSVFYFLSICIILSFIDKSFRNFIHRFIKR